MRIYKENDKRDPAFDKLDKKFKDYTGPNSVKFPDGSYQKQLYLEINNTTIGITADIDNPESGEIFVYVNYNEKWNREISFDFDNLSEAINIANKLAANIYENSSERWIDKICKIYGLE